MSIQEILGNRMLFLDGGMGTLLQERGLKPGELPETWNISHAEAVIDIHKAYLEAGADIILANTFGANCLKFGEDLEAIVTAGVVNAKRAVVESGREAFVALDMGPTGKLLKPMGTLAFEDAVAIYKEVAAAGEKAGADLIVIETMSDTYELKAAVLAAKEVTSLPVIATVIFGENEKMLTGATPEAVVALLEGLRVDAIGMNCGLGPKQMKPIFARMAACASVPLVISPNAGLPRTENGRTVFDVSGEEFAEDMAELAGMGAWILGGCCGTTPAHIKAMVDKCRDIAPKPLIEKDMTLVSSYSRAVVLGGKPMIIGERINPTGKSRFKQALRDHNIEYILEEGVKQVDAGAHILDVNVGLPEIDEVLMMQEAVYELQGILDTPLQIDTTNMAAMEQAMRIYNGKPMVNSVNGKAEVMEQVFPLVQKYGGVVVALCLDESGIPGTVEGRLAIAEKIYATAAQYGISRKDIVVDALTMTMSTDDNSAQVTLDTVKRIREKGGRTVLGVSNISFGLPQRELINSAFFTMALQAGLSAGIINPNAGAMMQAYDTYLVLGGFDKQCAGYVEKYAQAKTNINNVTAQPAVSQAGSLQTATGTQFTLRDCIIKGFKEQTAKATTSILSEKAPLDIINEELVPALDVVGKGFEKGTMFLPQLLKSAEAAQEGFAVIKEFMQQTGHEESKKATVVLATVKGDIHDIGKNIVKVLLENYAYDVIDLGKDVSAEAVVEAVAEKHAPIVGLSALMTTTVASMEDTIRLLRERAPWCKVMVGGAVLTQEYADRIGADFYAKDAMQAVYFAEQLQ
ncbi:MAG: homocysteine S-methyltransferase family protein [Lachnospiraceae bacterium]|nr:homocysteine S-methyltransferase family protein [Lachnospiraceae bacterium]